MEVECLKITAAETWPPSRSARSTRLLESTPIIICDWLSVALIVYATIPEPAPILISAHPRCTARYHGLGLFAPIQSHASASTSENLGFNPHKLSLPPWLLLLRSRFLHVGTREQFRRLNRPSPSHRLLGFARRRQSGTVESSVGAYLEHPLWLCPTGAVFHVMMSFSTPTLHLSHQAPRPDRVSSAPQLGLAWAFRHTELVVWQRTSGPEDRAGECHGEVMDRTCRRRPFDGSVLPVG